MIVLTLSVATLGCKHNAYGLMLGCSQVRKHTYDNLRLLFWRGQVREFFKGLFCDAAHTIVALAGIGSFLSGLVAFVPGLAV